METTFHFRRTLMIKDLPEKLRLLRSENKYTQKQLAELLDVSPSIVSGYETG